MKKTISGYRNQMIYQLCKINYVSIFIHFLSTGKQYSSFLSVSKVDWFYSRDWHWHSISLNDLLMTECSRVYTVSEINTFKNIKTWKINWWWIISCQTLLISSQTHFNLCSKGSLKDNSLIRIIHNPWSDMPRNESFWCHCGTLCYLVLWPRR